MDIDKALTNFVQKEDLVNYIRQLPDNSSGVLCFATPTEDKDEDGDPEQVLQYMTYGSVSIGDAVLFGHEIIDFARGL